MGMLARGIPEELRREMSSPDAIDLGWARNFTALHEPDDERPGYSFYPGWKLMKEHLQFEEALSLIKANSHREIVGSTWEEVESFKRDDLHQHLPIIPQLLQCLAKALGKTLYVTNVAMSDGAGVYEEITVFKIPPQGEIVTIDI